MVPIVSADCPVRQAERKKKSWQRKPLDPDLWMYMIFLMHRAKVTVDPRFSRQRGGNGMVLWPVWWPPRSQPLTRLLRRWTFASAIVQPLIVAGGRPAGDLYREKVKVIGLQTWSIISSSSTVCCCWVPREQFALFALGYIWTGDMFDEQPSTSIGLLGHRM